MEPTAGWTQVFRGDCVNADVLHAVLESSGLTPLVQRYSPGGMWFSGTVIEDCLVFVPEVEVERAREILASHADSP